MILMSGAATRIDHSLHRGPAFFRREQGQQQTICPAVSWDPSIFSIMNRNIWRSKSFLRVTVLDASVSDWPGDGTKVEGLTIFARSMSCYLWYDKTTVGNFKVTSGG